VKSSLNRFLTGRTGRALGLGIAILIAAAFLAGPAAGQGLQVANSVQADEVIDNDLLLT
jgi:hypothetical protein